MEALCFRKKVIMNKRTVNISSLVLLLSLLALITTICLYYLIPQHYVSVIFAAVASVLLTHFFLESSLNYDYNFLHSASMTISTLAFAICIYIIQPNEWITFDSWLPCLVLINWLVPFLYCTLRDLFDRGPRFDGYHKFFNRMCIFFTFIYIFVITKQYFITPLVPPYHNLEFGAHNFVPFMATGSYIEQALKAGKNLDDFILYATQIVCLGIPFGYLIRVALRKLNFILRILVYILFPTALETAQYMTNCGRGDIDDAVFLLIGILIGLLLFHIMNTAFQKIAARDFMISRAQQKKYHF